MHPKKPIKPTKFLKHFSKFNLFFITMASLFTIALIISLVLFFSISSASHHHHHNNKSPHNSQIASNPLVHEACKASRDPSTCEISIANFKNLPSSNPTLVDVIQSAVGVSKDKLQGGVSMVKNILSLSSGNLNRSNAAKVCIEVLGYSAYRMDSTVEVLPRGDKIKDARAWMSAALAYQYDCWSALKYVNGTSQVNETMSFLDSLMGLSSNALSMMWNYDNFGDKTGSWGLPKTERNGFWDRVGGSGGLKARVGGSGLKLGVPGGLKADVTVCKTGGCDYKAVQEAVNAAPANAGKRFVIGIKEGVYEEIVRVPLEKKNVVFLGDGIGKTVITGSLNVGQPGMTTLNSATVAVVGDGFMATDLTIQNTAGSDAHQAVAFRSDSDLSFLENCEFLGNQDTLYAHTLRQFYKSCRIQGNVDFIFGNSAAFFQDCVILVAPRQSNPEKGHKNAVTAHGRIDPAQSTGFVFENCLINGTDGYMTLYFSKPKGRLNFLGRPWKEYSRTVFIQCNMEALITPDGWLPWSGDFAIKTLYYGEFQNKGPGANVSARVPWSSKIPAEHVGSYTVQSFIQGDEWIPTSS
ncbi:esterase [Lithospermum erythrorhizon]|uniref:pectinesterase n=1 Tax=Lithospermum erythrorhizon TaxID=34254 RepID=A0AAV3R0X4_LITER